MWRGGGQKGQRQVEKGWRVVKNRGGDTEVEGGERVAVCGGRDRVEDREVERGRRVEKGGEREG